MAQFAHYIIKRPISISDGDWSLIITDFLILQEHLQGILGGSAGEGKPVINRKDDFILFNGKGDQACEDFKFAKAAKDQPFYIKTGKMPYDLAVQVSLLILKKFLKSDFKFETQGTSEDWAEAIAMFKVVFDQDPPQLFEFQGDLLTLTAELRDMTGKNQEAFLLGLKELLGKHSNQYFLRLNGKDVD